MLLANDVVQALLAVRRLYHQTAKCELDKIARRNLTVGNAGAFKVLEWRRGKPTRMWTPLRYNSVALLTELLSRVILEVAHLDHLVAY